ncbi:CDF family zinc transporter ZitB [Escherichia coli]|uniref:CDF family zinc transporter ZitB n=1 Tax=Escherichia coli TaxID=562 RepID=UPI0035C8CB94
MRHTSPPQNNNFRQLILAFGVTAGFMIIETIGGFISGSLALLADAGHMLTDSAALLFALLAMQFARRPPDNRYTFGWLRLTTLAAFINAIALGVITFFIVWEAIQRFNRPQPVAGATMMVIAVAGLIVNLIALWILHQGEEDKNLNIRAAALHVLGDLLGSAGAITAAIVIILTGWTPVDPILSVLVSCLILRSAWQLLKESMGELLESAPRSIDVNELKYKLKRMLPEVCHIHHAHLWQIGEKPVLTLHIQIDSPYDHDMLLGRIQHFLEEQYQIEHSTIQMEYQSCSDTKCYLNEAQTRHCRHN